MTTRWRMRTLLVLVALAAFGMGGGRVVRSSQETPRKRAEAIMALVKLRPRPASAEATLIAALDDPDESIRSMAVWGLDRIGSNSPALVRALAARLEALTEDVSMEHKWDMFWVEPARALKRIKPPAAALAPMLRKAMESPDRSTRQGTTIVLGESAGWPGPPSPRLASLLLAALQDPEPAIRMHASEGLARLDAATRHKAVAILLDQLRRPDRPTQILAAIGLCRFGPEAAPAVAILTDRLRVADAATPPIERPKPAGKPGPPTLIIQMHSPGIPGEEVGGILGARLADLYLLGRLGPVAKSAVPAIVREMTSDDAGQNVPFFYGAFLPRRDTWAFLAIEPVLGLDECRSAYNPAEVGAVAIGRIGPEAEREAVGLLVGMLGGSRRSEVHVALAALGPKASAAIPALLAQAEEPAPEPVGNGDWIALFKLNTALRRVCPGDDPRLVATMLRMMKSPSPAKRSSAADVLSDLVPPAPSAIPALIAALKDEALRVRFSVSRTLGRYDGPEVQAAVPALIVALDDENVWVRIHAADSLARLRAGADRAVPKLVPLLRSENPTVRSQAAKSLGTFGPAASAATPALREVSHDPTDFVRDSAGKALEAIAVPRDSKEPPRP